MTTSSNKSGDNGGGHGLRFRPVFCNCKKVATLRIVTGQFKASKGKLYFVCERNECGFFKWCEPIDGVEASSSPSTVTTASESEFPSESELVASVLA